LPGHPTPAFFSPESCEKSTKNFLAYRRAGLFFSADFQWRVSDIKIDMNQLDIGFYADFKDGLSGGYGDF
jgi:hypothetical protein